VNGYIFNRRWTFAARDSTRGRFLYVTVAAIGALSSSLLVLLFVRGAGTGKVEAYAAAIPPGLLPCVLLGGPRLELKPDEALVAENLCVVTGLDHVRLAGSELHLGPVLVGHTQPAGMHDTDVPGLTAVGARHRLDAL
jgi:hypothetical protein